jgi:hypothetical protein
MALVVYVLPLREPLQPVTLEMLYPEFGVTVNWAALPDATTADVGLMEPPDPALAVTVWILGTNIAVMVQWAVTAPVV